MVRLLKSKDEVAGVIREYIAMISTRFNRWYPRDLTEACCVANGQREGVCYTRIRRFLTRSRHTTSVYCYIQYMSQQNEIAERKNRTLVESAKCMLLDAGLDKCFWREAMLNAAYLQNRMTSCSIERTPTELFIGEKPDISHVRIFGSKFIRLFQNKRGKNGTTRRWKKVYLSAMMVTLKVTGF